MRLPQVALAIAVLAGVTAQARADTSSATSIESLIDQSELVVLGRVASAIAAAEGPEGQPGIHTRVEVDVEESLRGPAGSTVTFWVQGGRLGDRMRRVSGQAAFSVGERVVVFLRRAPTGSLWPAGMARGKWNVLEAAGRTIAAPAAGLGDAHVGGALDAIELDALLERVRTARSGQ